LNEGIGRIVNFHTAQEKKYVSALVEGANNWNKPVFVASELGNADPHNPAIEELKKEKMFCHYSGASAVSALAKLEAYARFKETITTS